MASICFVPSVTIEFAVQTQTMQKLRYAKTGEQIMLQSMSSARIADAAAAAAAESPLPTAKKSHDPSGPLEKLRLRRTIRYEMLF